MGLKNRKIIIFSGMLFLLLLVMGCTNQEEEKINIINEEGNIIGEATKYSNDVYKIRNRPITLKEETYIEAFDLESLPREASVTEWYLNPVNIATLDTEHLNAQNTRPGNLNPFPTKSLQSYYKLKGWGIVDSEEADLKLFYLQEGPQTKITEIIRDTANLIQTGTTTEETIKNIMEWEHQTYDNLCNSTEKAKLDYNFELNKYASTFKRKRTASEIISSKCFTGCTDYVTVFAALARAKGIPATVTDTVREKWIAEMAWNNQWIREKEGHFFSEVFFSDKNIWIVVDPTANKLTGRDEKGYYPSGPGGYKKFILFERGLDSWDYGIKSDAQFGELVKKRYYVESGDQP